MNKTKHGMHTVTSYEAWKARHALCDVSVAFLAGKVGIVCLSQGCPGFCDRFECDAIHHRSRYVAEIIPRDPRRGRAHERLARKLAHRELSRSVRG